MVLTVQGFDSPIGTVSKGGHKLSKMGGIFRSETFPWI